MHPCDPISWMHFCGAEGAPIAHNIHSATMKYWKHLGCMLAALGATGCSTSSRDRIVVYDQKFAISAGPRNRWCSSQSKTSCDEEAEAEEAAFLEELGNAFRSAPECSKVQFLVDSGEGNDHTELERKLKQNPASRYWRLRVDFHPVLNRQPFDLSPGTAARPGLGGDDAQHQVGWICEVVKRNGVADYW